MKAKTKRSGRSVTSEYDNTEELVDEYIRVTLDRPNRVEFFASLIVFALGGVALLTRFDTALTAGILFAGVLLLVDALWRSKYRAKRRTLKGYEVRYGGVDVHVKVVLDESGIRYDVNGDSMSYGWEDVRRVGQSTHLVVLICGSGIVPIAKTTSAKQMSDLETIIKDHIPMAKGLK